MTVNPDLWFLVSAGLQASELFLQQMVSLYVASHYKNTPNDLLLMADAPAHRLFVLLAPVDEATNALPDILAVVQVSYFSNDFPKHMWWVAPSTAPHAA